MKPRVDELSGRKTYGLMMLFPPPFDDGPFRLALKEAMIVKHGPDIKQWPKIKRGPDDVIKDFDVYNREIAKTPLPGNWKGWMFMNANAIAGEGSDPPAVVGPLLGPDGKFPLVTDAREIYGGRWARATLDAYYFSVRVNNGVTFGLSNVQLLKPDTKFGYQRAAAESDFDEVTGEMAGEGDAFMESRNNGKDEDEDDTKW
jgi:hypothetical protein